MNQKIQKPFLPYVTLDEAMAFDPQKPETRTASPLVNAVLEGMAVVQPLTGKDLAKYLNLSYADMCGGVKCATGLSFSDLLTHWTTRRIWRLIHDEPKLSTNEIALKAGFANRASLWKFLHRNSIVKPARKGYYEPHNSLLAIWRDDKRLE